MKVSKLEMQKYKTKECRQGKRVKNKVEDENEG